MGIRKRYMQAIPFHQETMYIYDTDDWGASRRYKMTDSIREPSDNFKPDWPCRLLYSPDGVEWRMDYDNTFLNTTSDTLNNMLKNHCISQKPKTQL